MKLRLEANSGRTPTYTVTLADGQSVSGLRKSDLGTYPRFKFACALAGVDFKNDMIETNAQIRHYRHEAKAEWLRLVARAVRAGSSEEAAE
jgi:hypothetical protein